MAFPAYLLAASLVDWGSYRGIQIHGLDWAIALLSLANYSYVFLLSTESFAMSGSRLLEAGRSLGVDTEADLEEHHRHCEPGCPSEEARCRLLRDHQSDTPEAGDAVDDQRDVEPVLVKGSHRAEW